MRLEYRFITCNYHSFIFHEVVGPLFLSGTTNRTPIAVLDRHATLHSRVVRRGDDVASRFHSHFPQGVDGLADGAVLNELVIPAVRDGGAFSSVRGFQGIPQRDIHFTATFVRSYAQEFEKLDRLRQQVEAGKITLRVAEVYPPERAADAHRRLEAGGTRGRLVIQF